MSVRRLAEIQPESFEFTPENVDWANSQVAKYPEGRQASAVIPLLWQAQKQNDGWVSEPVIRHVAEFLDMAYIRVLEVATFYTMFNLQPVGKHLVQLCGTTPCWLRGADDLKDVCRKSIGPEKTVSDDGQLSWMEVECLGACVNAPMVQINDDFYEDLDAASFADILTKLRNGETVAPGSQTGRQTSAPEGGPQALTEAPPYHAMPFAPVVEEAPEAVATEPEPVATPAPVTVRDEAEKAPEAIVEEAASDDTAEAGSETDVAVGTTVEEDTSGTASSAQADLFADEASSDKADDDVPVADATESTEAGSGSVDGERPEGLPAARDGKADDLKQIKGIGPKLEGTLNGLGVFHFDQIAGWSRSNVGWVDEHLSFKGRIDREQWIPQAKGLAGISDGVQPPALDGPRGGTPDDLRKISGVGPKIEDILHSLGIYHFDQIAAWSPDHVEWVDEKLRFKGRIGREDWISQATALVEGVSKDGGGA